MAKIFIKNKKGFTPLKNFVNYKENRFLFKIQNLINLALVKFNRKSDSLTGFTLIETILYLAIVGIILTSIIEFSITLGNTTTKLSSNIDVSRDRRLSLNVINYLIRNADGFLKDVNGDCSSFGVTPPILALYFEDDTWLPGTCVENGGGVKITVSSNRIKMTCYPNITNNGQYGACAATSGNSYWLTSPNLIVTNNNLSFATSTATSTSDGFKSITTYVNVSIPSADQVRLKASSAATSTAVLKNEQPNGLVSWWKFDDDTVTAAIDSAGDNDLDCTWSPEAVSGLVNGSNGAYYFNLEEGDYCYLSDYDDLNPANAFTIVTWLKVGSCSCITQSFLMSKYSSGGKKGYTFYIDRNSTVEPYDLVFGVCDSNDCTELTRASDVIYDDTVYHVSAIYDLNNDIAKMYIYEKEVGGISTTTADSLPILVNFDWMLAPIIGINIEGTLDELRFYNRALIDKEIWALQSSGN